MKPNSTPVTKTRPVRAPRKARLLARMATSLATLAAGAATLAPAAAQANDTFQAEVKLEGAPVAMSCAVSFPQACWDPSERDSALVRVKFHEKFASIDNVCFDLRFEGDLVDPGPTPEERGDMVQFTFPGTYGFGFVNWSEPPIARREICTGEPSDGEAAAFADGKEDIVVNMVLGSATLAGVQVRLTGVAR